MSGLEEHSGGPGVRKAELGPQVTVFTEELLKAHPAGTSSPAWSFSGFAELFGGQDLYLWWVRGFGRSQ